MESATMLRGACLNDTIVVNPGDSTAALTISLSAINGSYNVVSSDSSGIRVLRHKTMTFGDSRFDSNEGGCVVWPGAHTDGNDSVNCLFFVNNTAGGSGPEGGSIFCAGASYTLTDCVFVRNSGRLLGIVPDVLPVVTFFNCIFDGEPSTTGSGASVAYLSSVILASDVEPPDFCPWPTATKSQTPTVAKSQTPTASSGFSAGQTSSPGPSAEDDDSFVGTAGFYGAVGGGVAVIIVVIVVIIVLRYRRGSGGGKSDSSDSGSELDERRIRAPPAV